MMKGLHHLQAWSRSVFPYFANIDFGSTPKQSKLSLGEVASVRRCHWPKHSSPFDPRTATASDLQELLRASKVTSVQLVKIYLKQIEQYNSYLKAVISTAPKSAILDKAEKLDAERAEGNVRSSLHGIPILIKDNIATHPSLGMDTTAGSLALVGSRPKKSADVVERLISAGALILGKANLCSAYVQGGLKEDDTAGGHSNPGGSSSGSAIGVSAGFAPVSIGTETSGSLIFPGSRAALYSIKPTIGLVSQAGIVPLSSIFDAAGPMTKSALDLADLLDVIVDPTKTRIPDRGYASALSGSWAELEVGVLDPVDWDTSESWTEPDPGVTKQMRQAYEDAYAKIKDQAKKFHRNVPLPTVEALEIDGERATRILNTGYYKEDLESYMGDLEYSQVYTLEALIEFNRKHADQELPPRYPRQDRLEKALAHNYTTEDLEKALAHARRIGRDEGIDKILKEYDIDVIIGPADSKMPTIAAASGSPIAGMPLGYLEFNGRPFGMAALASGHQEAILVKTQSAWEATFGPRQPPPIENFAFPMHQGLVGVTSL
ncbi:hypothetical protein JMJ35_010234 [Cladonia borealis]|uniref:Amidase domain-containing protein n=1 Tax=Cladonia borealis TaxID=184061 RepID=A0AA39QRP6_9LECA|nr:hypothetical protein JMJ35_010234 [Cladonia borealis]